jgi:hypothetical protein
MEKGNVAGLAGVTEVTGVAGLAGGSVDSVGIVERTTTLVTGIGEELGTHASGKAMDRAAEAVIDHALERRGKDPDEPAADDPAGPGEPPQS